MRSSLSHNVAKFYGRPQKAVAPQRSSKHAAGPFGGLCRIGPETGLRKLMRASRRGLLPQERIFIILNAIRNSLARTA